MESMMLFKVDLGLAGKNKEKEQKTLQSFTQQSVTAEESMAIEGEAFSSSSSSNKKPKAQGAPKPQEVPEGWLAFKAAVAKCQAAGRLLANLATNAKSLELRLEACQSKPTEVLQVFQKDVQKVLEKCQKVQEELSLQMAKSKPLSPQSATSELERAFEGLMHGTDSAADLCKDSKKALDFIEGYLQH